MSVLESNALLERILAELGEIRGLLAARLPEQKPIEVQPSPKAAVVTGEGSEEGSTPITAAKKAVPGRRR